MIWDEERAVDVFGYSVLARFWHCVPQYSCIEVGTLSSRWVDVQVMKSWSPGQTQKVMVNRSYSTWRSVASVELVGSVLGLLLDNVVIRDLEEVMEHALANCADSKLRMSAFSSQVTFHRPEWAGWMGWQGSCETVEGWVPGANPGIEKPLRWHMLGMDRLGISLWKGPWGLVP